MEDRFTLFDVVMMLLVIGAILAGCGSPGGHSTSGAGAIDACKLITAADAEATLGGAVKPPESPVSGEGLAVVTSCKYAIAAAPSVNNVTLIVRKLDTVSTAQQDFDQMKKDMVTQLNVTPRYVDGLGDAAFWSGGAVNQLAVLKGKVQLLVMVSGAQGAAPDVAAEALADKALSRLP